MMRRMRVRDGAKALDVCCGTADWTIALAKAAGPSGEVTGLILVKACLKREKKKLKTIQQLHLFTEMRWNYLFLMKHLIM